MSDQNSNQSTDNLSVALFSEMFMADQLARNRLSKALPKGMELSHFSVLNHLARSGEEKSPAQLAKAFHVTRGAITNTLNKLEWAGHIHVRPDWDDARRKFVTISPAGRAARDAALQSITPIIGNMVTKIGKEKIKQALPVLREMRQLLSDVE
ncbi:MarR family transcriptional regulator [Aliiroseovarius sp. KMU-50]|uniref:MarR family transcriptional regulator n=1 Tax=Aliiroseovarius salicola TaxID=3009082 RepID=A0ABT4VXN3_9RHOB|nr:MarR family transcriptional regulator [Aliiroseovarius sp. KMU-50]MDA5093007.1 MarR family transcriptional regulator [Aliiroseovarius sp. KMU-50]